ncbi:GNAT family N-acetyltransferase [Methylomonas sp. MED-D]|uniref:Acetyltransferase n=1 Tax=Methylomonas koyamae TaxID=702114 RepID=A0A177NQ55_9GAMM|nr:MULTISPECIES: GNAT family N-acetyltransferase [Methylomonas]MDT4329290.1 GNAT family N-acetyltransferase [Methylomonas sp. MV1]OAI19170.1 acetyltransferase [Methylomonas koyamae]WGS87511.1 GNAT family N-acetyltransferase [Methylomonas sp. UP202]
MALAPSPAGLNLRPQRDNDATFLAGLYHSLRDDLRLLDAERDFVEELIEMQFRAQREGYGQQFPNAMYFIIEIHSQAVGRVAVDFGHNEVRLIDLALLPAARNRGHGRAVIRALQQAAGQAHAPLTLVAALDNPGALAFYAKLGFGLARTSDSHALLVWYPGGA